MAAVASAVARGFGIATGAYLAERDDWTASLRRARAEGWRELELTAITVERLEELVEHLASAPDALDGFDRVSVHAPGGRLDGDPQKLAESLRGVPHDIVLHPDAYRGRGWVRELGSRAVFENMDAAKAFGRGAEDLSEIFTAFPDAGLCLDVAHVWTNDWTLALGHRLIDEHGGRLRQLHVSGIERDGTHRATTTADLELYEPLLARCEGVPWLLEGELAEDT